VAFVDFRVFVVAVLLAQQYCNHEITKKENAKKTF